MQEFETPEYQEQFEEMDISTDVIKQVISFCAGDGEVEYNELCEGICSMEDEPKKKDTWEIISKVVQMDKKIVGQLSTLNRKMGALLENRGYDPKQFEEQPEEKKD